MGTATAIGLGIPAALVGLAIGHDVGDSALEVVLVVAVFAFDLLAVGLLVNSRVGTPVLSAHHHTLMLRAARWGFGATAALAAALLTAVLLGAGH